MILCWGDELDNCTIAQKTCLPVARTKCLEAKQEEQKSCQTLSLSEGTNSLCVCVCVLAGSLSESASSNKPDSPRHSRIIFLPVGRSLAPE